MDARAPAARTLRRPDDLVAAGLVPAAEVRDLEAVAARSGVLARALAKAWPDS